MKRRHGSSTLTGLTIVLASMTAHAEPVVSAEAWQSRLAHAVEGATAVRDGSRGPLLHVFVDEACGACRALIHHLAPLTAAGQLTVRWIPVQLAPHGGAAAPAIRANTALLELVSGTRAAPTLVYRAPDGLLRVQIGAADLPADLRRPDQLE